MSKKEYSDFIHELTIASSVSVVCRDLGIERSNVANGSTTEENMQQVAEELIKRVQEVLKKYER